MRSVGFFSFPFLLLFVSNLFERYRLQNKFCQRAKIGLRIRDKNRLKCDILKYNNNDVVVYINAYLCRYIGTKKK